MQKKQIVIGVVGIKKNPIGEAHHSAILSDEEVELIRAIHEQGEMGYEKIARAFGVSKSSVQHIVTYRRRACTPDSYKTIDVYVGDDGEIVRYKETDDHKRGDE